MYVGWEVMLFEFINEFNFGIWLVWVVFVVVDGEVWSGLFVGVMFVVYVWLVWKLMVICIIFILFK